MEYVCLDFEGVLVPEIWSEIATFTGEDKFNLTTQDVRNYSELMDMRIELVHELNISIDEINQLVRKMEPFSGAKEFLDWLRDNYQMTIVSDSFYQLAWPLIQKLGTPPIICHRLKIGENKIRGYDLRQKDNKRKVVKALQGLKYRVFASGDSYNDIQMLQQADLGVFFRAPSHIKEEFHEIPEVETYKELQNIFSKASEIPEKG